MNNILKISSLCSIILLIIIPFTTFTQADISFQLDRYRASTLGLNSSLGVDIPVKKNSFGLSIGYVRDFGEPFDKDLADGGGLSGRGFSLGFNFKRYFSPEAKGTYLGLQNDFIMLNNSSVSFVGGNPSKWSSSKIQPQLQLGYHYLSPKSNSILDVYIGVGIESTKSEFNDGELFGMWRFGLRIGKRVKSKK